jgi:hypothetical protein
MPASVKLLMLQGSFSLGNSEMSIWGKLAGAAAELAKGGPIGALLGGVGDQEKDGPAENQVAFTVWA